MNPLQPYQVTARAQKTAYENTGEFGCPTGKCTMPVGIQFFYDDPLETPITDLGINIITKQGEAIVQGPKTESLLTRGLQDSDEGVEEIRQELGGFSHSGIEVKNSPLSIETDYDEAAEKEAWEIEKNIVAGLHTVEEAMKTKLKPYVAAWQKDGLSSAITAYNSGRMKGLQMWWDEETDFWNTIPKVAGKAYDAVYDHYAENPWRLFGPYAAYEAATNIWDSIGQSAAQAAWGKMLQLSALMKALLYGDIDGVISNLKDLTGLSTVEGYIGEFGKMLKDALDKGVEWLRDMIEVIRRTPVFGLIARTFMRIIVHMTPNFWAEGMGTFEGYIIPEAIIMLISSIIAALSVGAGSLVLALRCAAIVKKIRLLFSGNKALKLMGVFMDAITELVNKVGKLAKKLRQSIKEVEENLSSAKNKAIKMVEVRYFKRRLNKLRHHGPGAHGVQRHEGEVTAKMLDDRCLHGKDPMTGTTTDGVHGGNHGYGKDATKINTPADFVRAYEYIIKDPSFLAAKALGEPKIITQIPMEKIFDSDFKSRLFGRTRVGSKNNPSHAVDTVFPDNTELFAIFKKNTDGSYYLYTMYPKFP